MVVHLSVRSLSKTFTLHLLGGRAVRALQPVSFDVPEGAFVAVIGRSGSGKSSLIRCLYRTYLPTTGQALLRTTEGDIVDIASADDETILRLRRTGELGYVSQFLRPTPRVTAVDLIAEPLRRRGMARDEARLRARTILQRLDLPANLHDGFPTLFSGGEQQRVNLARAMVTPSRLLLLDEPTSALDSTSQEAVIELLAEKRAAGTTIVGIFHDLELVRRLADTVLHLEHGELIAFGAPATVVPPRVPSGAAIANG